MKDRLVANAKWETEDKPTSFRHRITLGDRAGDWVGYDFIALLRLSDRKFIIGVTNYYAGILPTEQPLLVEVIKED
jgi:hypothetical protein